MASKRRIRRKACTGKQQHTRETAYAHAYALWKSKGETVQPYRCRFGNHWHVGHR